MKSGAAILGVSLVLCASAFSNLAVAQVSVGGPTKQSAIGGPVKQESPVMPGRKGGSTMKCVKGSCTGGKG
jgi:hypothetical protein